MSNPTSPPASDADRRSMPDRRSGKDRRQQEAGPPSSYERRRAIEARQPEVAELDLSPEELEALGFIHPPGNATR
ncbi:MAG: hypothetical protein RBS27_01125 [Giesbergeria sp.]|jgi:hypothetical protein|nr:hypothetical protein [Giesbergeria sp.]